MDEDPIRLRMISETCRRVVGGITDTEAIERLTALADECDTKLRAISEPKDGQSQRSD